MAFKHFAPMLAGKAPKDLNDLTYPVLVSKKLDGIRCLMRSGVAYSRKLKLIPNRYIQAKLEGLPDFDGELIVGSPTGSDVMNRATSGVMSEDGEPSFAYFVFDRTDMHYAAPYSERLAELRKSVAWLPKKYDNVVFHEHYSVDSPEAIMQLATKWVDEGYEGLMIRTPIMPYKLGRSTTREAGLLKLKFWDDAESYAFGKVELMHNGNEKERDELGHAKRSSAKGGKTPLGTLGAIRCVHTATGCEFEIGTGFDMALRRKLWDMPNDELSNLIVKYKHQGVTPDGVPRFPVFLGFRNPDDL